MDYMNWDPLLFDFKLGSEDEKQQQGSLWAATNTLSLCPFWPKGGPSSYHC